MVTTQVKMQGDGEVNLDRHFVKEYFGDAKVSGKLVHTTKLKMARLSYKQNGNESISSVY